MSRTNSNFSSVVYFEGEEEHSSNEVILVITKNKEINLDSYKLITQPTYSSIPDNCKLILVDDDFIPIESEVPILVMVNDLDKIDFLIKKTFYDFIIYPFSKEELEARIIITINHFHSEKKISNEIYIDDLTELYNKKFLYIKLKELIDARANFSIIMLDIDNFSLVNSSWGHIKGDSFLKSFAAIIKSAIRNTDFSFRFGGEEFIIILKNSDCLVAEKIYQRLVKTLQKTMLPFTISSGITAKIDSDSNETILERVDRALIEAKNNGKNRFCLV